MMAWFSSTRSDRGHMKNLILIFLIVLCAPLANATGLDFLLNGVTKPVKVDTVTPSNSMPYPFMYFNSSGLRTDLGTEATLQTINTNILGVNTTIQGIDFATETTLQSVLSGITTLNGKDFATQTTLNAINTKTPALGQAASAASTPVVLASDQSTLPVSQVSATGSFAQITNLVATAQTFTAPANAIGFKIQAPSTNTQNIAFSVGSTATITAGILMEPGRSEDFEVGSNISVIATSATAQKVTVIWRIRP